MTTGPAHPPAPTRPGAVDSFRAASTWSLAFAATVLVGVAEAWATWEPQAPGLYLGALALHSVLAVALAATAARLRRGGPVLPVRVLVALELFLGTAGLTATYAGASAAPSPLALAHQAAFVVTGIGACVALVRARFASVAETA